MRVKIRTRDFHPSCDLHVREWFSSERAREKFTADFRQKRLGENRIDHAAAAF
jgi:hypothetical protein